MTRRADRHQELMALWTQIGRDPVVPVPQYERADANCCQYYRPRVDRYAFQGKE